MTRLALLYLPLLRPASRLLATKKRDAGVSSDWRSLRGREFAVVSLFPRTTAILVLRVFGLSDLGLHIARRLNVAILILAPVMG